MAAAAADPLYPSPVRASSVRGHFGSSPNESSALPCALQRDSRPFRAARAECRLGSNRTLRSVPDERDDSDGPIRKSQLGRASSDGRPVGLDSAGGGTVRASRRARLAVHAGTWRLRVGPCQGGRRARAAASQLHRHQWAGRAPALQTQRTARRTRRARRRLGREARRPSGLDTARRRRCPKLQGFAALLLLGLLPSLPAAHVPGPA